MKLLGKEIVILISAQLLCCAQNACAVSRDTHLQLNNAIILQVKVMTQAAKEHAQREGHDPTMRFLAALLLTKAKLTLTSSHISRPLRSRRQAKTASTSALPTVLAAS